MSDAVLLDLVRSTQWIAKLLLDFDFDTERVADGPVEPVHLAAGEPRPFGDNRGGELRAWLARADAEIREDWPGLDARRR